MKKQEKNGHLVAAGRRDTSNVLVDTSSSTTSVGVPVNTASSGVSLNTAPVSIPVNTAPVGVPVNTAPVGVPINTTSADVTAKAATADITVNPTAAVATFATAKNPNKCATSEDSGVEAQTMGMKHSKSDHSALGRKDKHKDSKSCFGKKYISKSQDNLSGQKKSKPLATVVESPKPRETATSLARAEAARSDKNKENVVVVKEKDKNSSFAKPKSVKVNSLSTNMRKTSSTQSIDRTSQSSFSIKSATSKSSNNLAIKRAQSTQNVSKDNFMKKRTSAPADVMAYNAELLANFEKEKKILESRISELTKIAENRKGEIEKYKYEIKRLKDQLSCFGNAEEIELLRNQNKQLLDRLQELGFPAEQITDSEKLMLKLSRASAARSHDSNSDICLQASVSCDSLSTEGSGARGRHPPISMSGGGGKNLVMGAEGMGLHRSTSLSASEPGMSLPDLCGTPDHPSVLSLDTANWDKQSNKSANSDGALSEASVACLTERILQMEETNYSTTEELQATLQELGDLQDAVNELTEENTKLTDEKAVLLASLCTQTVKLENTRIQLEQLKCLLISGELPDKTERDIHLLELLKSAQEEREELMRKQFEWSNALESLENEYKEAHEAEEALRDKFSVVEETNTSLKAERDILSKQLGEMREVQAAEQIEVNRLKTLLENEKSKVTELETARRAQDKTDLEALLDIARQDKDRTDQKVADLAESLAFCQCEVTRLKECLTSKEQELAVVRSSAKTQISDLHFRIEVLEKEKLQAEREGDTLREHIDQLEADCDSQMEDKKNLTAKLQEVQTELRNTKQQRQMMEAELQEISCKHDVESEEWKQFQRDLQMAVVIANNFSQETQEKMEKLTVENTQLLEQVSAIKVEFDKLQQENKILKQTTEDFSSRKHSILTNAELKGKVLTTMDRELAVMREGRPHMDQRSQNISVKSLIHSIEEQVKSGCSPILSSHSESRRNSISSDTSLKDLVTTVSPLPTPDSPRSPTKEFSQRASGFKNRSVEKSPQSRHISGGAVGGGIPSPEGPAKGILGSRIDGSESGAGKVGPQISSILKDRNTPRRGSGIIEVDTPKKETVGRDPLSSLAKLMKGSKRNALLKWCQLKTIPYSNVDITNFSSSWNDGLGFCALLHSYVPEKIPYSELTTEDKRNNFIIAFSAAESIGIKATLNINDMVSMERPDWQAVMNYVTAIYRHFEVDKP